MQSNGGVTTAAAAAELPVGLVASGPAAGVIGASFVARLGGHARVITFDMGGTSTEACLIRNGVPQVSYSRVINGLPIRAAALDVHTVGAGGSSIATVDEGGLLRVGPQSAGSTPGPACYGLGGEQATVTDANVVLGRIDPANFLGGRMRLDLEAARTAVGRVAEALGRGVEETAVAIVRIVNNNMIGALRSVLIERGLDPRDFSLCAFGGATPLHASELCGELGIPRAIVPPHPGQFSAYGFILTDARVDRQRTTQLTSRRFDAKRANEVMDALVAESVGELAAQGHRPEAVEVYRGLEMRYLGQNYELELPLTFERLDEDASGRLWAAFHRAHEARFGFAIPGEVIEIVNYAVTATARTPKPEIARVEAGDGAAPEPVGRRTVWLVGGPAEIPVYDRSRLRAGDAIAGPALVEEAASVTVLDAGHRLVVDEYGHLLIDTRGG
jgi:N-methylhydantoinase A